MTRDWLKALPDLSASLKSSGLFIQFVQTLHLAGTESPLVENIVIHESCEHVFRWNLTRYG